VDLTPYVENVKRHTAELKRRNAEAQARARADLPRLVEVLRADGRVRKTYLFGSLAKGTFHPASDIDIAVEGLDFLECDRLARRLEGLTSFRVDVRELEQDSRFGKLILFYGELLHEQA